MNSTKDAMICGRKLLLISGHSLTIYFCNLDIIAFPLHILHTLVNDLLAFSVDVRYMLDH